MIRGTIAAVLVAGMAGWAATSASADEPVTDVSELELTWEDGALDSTTLGEVSGGALTGAPTDEEAWRDADAHAYPIDIPGSVNPAGSGIADSATLGAEMGAHSPAGGNALGAGAVAADVNNTIW